MRFYHGDLAINDFSLKAVAINNFKCAAKSGKISVNFNNVTSTHTGCIYNDLTGACDCECIKTSALEVQGTVDCSHSILVIGSNYISTVLDCQGITRTNSQEDCLITCYTVDCTVGLAAVDGKRASAADFINLADKL